MFTYQDRDVPKMPPPGKMHLPILPESVLEEMNDDNFDPKLEAVEPTLLKLPAANLKGTFAKAYQILTEITHQIGWDTLLKCRSSVFVMEEEYREEKKNASVTTLRGNSPRPSEDRASQNGVADAPETPAIATNGDGDGEGGSGGSGGGGGGGEKADSDREGGGEKADREGGGEKAGREGGGEKADGEGGGEKADSDGIQVPENPAPAKAKNKDGGDEDDTGSDADAKHLSDKYTHFKNKRLCERWLDNLFMVLYEVRPPMLSRYECLLTGPQDLRVYTIWRSEFSQHKQQSLPYKKNATEWEILGNLAQRLHHHDEALEAFRATLRMRFSPQALKGILRDQEKRRDNRETLTSIIKLTAWQYRWYSEVIPTKQTLLDWGDQCANPPLPVFSLAAVLGAETDRRRRRSQSEEHRAVDKLPAERAGPDPPLRAAVHGLPQQR